MSTIRFVECDTITDKIEFSAALQQAHWEETARNKHLMVLSPAVDIYRRIEESGALFGVIAYDGDKMVGYSVNILSKNLHYSALLMCNNDVLFVDKAYRVGRTSMRLIDETESVAAKRGARMMLWHAKENTALAHILPRRGCKVQDVLFSKELTQSNFRMFGSFDVTAALAEAEGTDLWDVFTARQETPGSPHHDTKCIVLREPASEYLTPDVVFNMIESQDTVAIHELPIVSRLCADACDRLGVKELGLVMLVSLQPGGHIDLHSDQGAYAAHYERFHLVLSSAPGNFFINGQNMVHMKPGELWKFNHRIEHEVMNHSSTPRIHLIIDATRE